MLEKETPENHLDRNSSLWENILPSLDLWLEVNDDDIHYVSHILPTLDWKGGFVGVRLRYEPKKIDILYEKYLEAHNCIKRLSSTTKNNKNKNLKNLFPKSMLDFLNRNLNNYFIIKYYILDPELKDTNQLVINEPLDENPLIDLIKINEINAQRGLNDEGSDTSNSSQRHLSKLLSKYYETHIDPLKDPTEGDIEAINAIYEAQKTFADSMDIGFKEALIELETLGYPGFHNPKIKLNPEQKLTDGLNHYSVLQYEHDSSKSLYLPETYNGLGYQNLIFMAFKLMSFRDSWLKIGKLNTQKNETKIMFSPIHLVLVEEPEAHLHPQAQQVFIKQAYNILTKKDDIHERKLTTQLIITTHSSHITNNSDFAELNYFKRIHPTQNELQCSEVISLSNVFGEDENTEKFVARNIKIAHCDLFFADAVIIIEGDAERILLPHFINNWELLTQSYISILSIGGSHAHVFQPLIEILGIPTLIITDIDAVGSKKNSIPVERGKGQLTSNETLKKWFPQKSTIDELLDLSDEYKEQNNPHKLRVTYQIPIILNGSEVLPYTFEDSLIFTNKELLDKINKPTSMIKKIQNINNAQDAFDKIRDDNFKKSVFVLELLYFKDFPQLKTPKYIDDGLQWLNNILEKKLSHISLIDKSIEVNND
jgi:predicted ATP-dependent endonuclease of OLD family